MLWKGGTKQEGTIVTGYEVRFVLPWYKLSPVHIWTSRFEPHWRYTWMVSVIWFCQNGTYYALQDTYIYLHRYISNRFTFLKTVPLGTYLDDNIAASQYVPLHSPTPWYIRGTKLIRWHVVISTFPCRVPMKGPSLWKEYIYKPWWVQMVHQR
jgi:hypothetical protein